MSGGETHDETIWRLAPHITVFALRPAEQRMVDRSNHKITVCVSCRHKRGEPDDQCRPGIELIARLRKAMTLAGDAIGADFAISGTVCMAGCDRPCTVAYFGSHKATYLFGDIAPESDLADTLAFAARVFRDHAPGAIALAHLERGAIARVRTRHRRGVC